MIPATTTRVQQHTDEDINDAIRRRTVANIRHYAREGRGQIDMRLMDLEYEWDMERVLEANAAGVSLLGLALGRFADRRWFILPAFVAGFLLQHAVQGWCPPVGLFRRLGFRTAAEIETERYALKVIRRDFDGLSAEDRAERIDRVLQAVAR